MQTVQERKRLIFNYFTVLTNLQISLFIRAILTEKVSDLQDFFCKNFIVIILPIMSKKILFAISSKKEQKNCFAYFYDFRFYVRFEEKREKLFLLRFSLSSVKFFLPLYSYWSYYYFQFSGQIKLAPKDNL